MNGALKIAVGAAAVVAVVLVGVAFLPRSTSPAGGAGGGPSASPSPTPTPAPTPTAAASAAVPEFPGVSDNVPAGTYLWAADQVTTPADITFTVPAGWTSRYGIPNKDRSGPGEIAVGDYMAYNIYTDRCQWKGALLDPPVGPTVDDLATALVAQKAWNATPPTDVTLGGYPAKRIELSIPADLDRASCDGGVMRTWAALGDDPVNAPVDTENLGMHPGQLNVTYIVDVNGDRLIIDTWHMPGTSAADLAELDAILASMRIEP